VISNHIIVKEDAMRTHPSGAHSTSIKELVKANLNRPKDEGRRFGLIIRNAADYTPTAAHDETDLSCTAYGLKQTVTGEENIPFEHRTVLSSCEIDEEKRH
jgi:hypothetical protein